MAAWYSLKHASLSESRLLDPSACILQGESCRILTSIASPAGRTFPRSYKRKRQRQTANESLSDHVRGSNITDTAPEDACTTSTAPAITDGRKMSAAHLDSAEVCCTPCHRKSRWIRGALIVRWRIWNALKTELMVLNQLSIMLWCTSIKHKTMTPCVRLRGIPHTADRLVERFCNR